MGNFSAASEDILSMLRVRGQSLATAESITGGLLGGALTEIPGASDVFLGGVIAYDERIKVEHLDVPHQLIHERGVVSKEVALAMARGVRASFASDWAISTTGVAGPGASGAVPAGTVWIAIVGPVSNGAVAEMCEQLALAGDRQAVRSATIARALAAFTRILSA